MKKLLDKLHLVKKKIKNTFRVIKSFHDNKRYGFKLHFYCLFSLKKKVFVVGSPEYENLGDSAITIAEMLFLEKCGYKKSQIKEITQSDFYKYIKHLGFLFNSHTIICGVGGGNMGNQWPAEELFRYDMMNFFTKQSIVIFPQTIFFTPDDAGEKAKNDSIVYYNDERITLVSREQESYRIMKSLYPKANVIMTPDIVLSSDMSDYGVTPNSRNGVLLVFRNDVEKSLSDSSINLIKEYLDSDNYCFRSTDMYSDKPVTKDNRFEQVRKKMQEFADSELVITDRLHGMVFATITNTPCIVFGNYNHKVSGTYEWLKDLGYIHFVYTTDEAISFIPELIKMKDCRFDKVKLNKKFNVLNDAINS